MTRDGWQCQVRVFPLQGMKSLPTTGNKNGNFMEVLLFLTGLVFEDRGSRKRLDKVVVGK